MIPGHLSANLSIGRYWITGELGRGAMGVVYEALDPVIGRKLAVKVIRLQAFSDSGEAEFLRQRLFREARSAGRLFHPGIVTVYDVDQNADLAFIAMEKVDGISLDRILESGRRFSTAEALEILRRVAVALDYAHQNGVIHRDVKPANIMMEKGVTPKVVDFGIAKITSTDVTLTGMVMGTPSYMSPEQIEGLRADGRADQFSLGVVAYELLSGNLPFQADSMASMAHMIVYSDRPLVTAKNPELPRAVDVVLHRSLARFPQDRYRSCAEFVAALDAASKAFAPTPALSLPAVEGGNVRSGAFLKKLLGVGLPVICLVGFLLYTFLSSERSRAIKPIAPVLPKSSNRSMPGQSRSHARRLESPIPGHIASDATELRPPIVVRKVQGSYSEIAAKLGVEGTILLAIVVLPDGMVSEPKIKRSLGYGMDEKAIEAVRKWQFKPAMQGGKAVSQPATVEMTINVYGSRASGRWRPSGAIIFNLEDGLAAPALKNGELPRDVTGLSDESVVFEFTVDPSGSVKNIQSISGPASSSDLLSGYLSKWTFRPAMKGDQTTEATGRIRFVKGKGDEAAQTPLN